jgi:hypothetical protein
MYFNKLRAWDLTITTTQKRDWKICEKDDKVFFPDTIFTRCFVVWKVVCFDARIYKRKRQTNENGNDIHYNIIKKRELGMWKEKLSIHCFKNIFHCYCIHFAPSWTWLVLVMCFLLDITVKLDLFFYIKTMNNLKQKNNFFSLTFLSLKINLFRFSSIWNWILVIEKALSLILLSVNFMIIETIFMNACAFNVVESLNKNLSLFNVSFHLLYTKEWEYFVM